MNTKKGKFIYIVSPEVVIDLGEIGEIDWKKIKNEVKRLLKEKETDDIGMAYIIAFVFYIDELSQLSEPFDEEQDLYH